MDTDLLDRFNREGYVVLRGAFDPIPLVQEFDRVAADAYGDGRSATTLAQGSGTVTFRSVPMMCERTPISVALIEPSAVIAAELLGRAVLAGRAKGTWYQSDTAWHRDSEHNLASVGVLAYLEPLDGATGALRVLPGSHVDHDRALPEGTAPAGTALETVPGDVIVLDEHLIHGSSRGRDRRQWRVDFLVDPCDQDEHSAAAGWFDQSIPDERHDPAYTEHYPSYGPYWQAHYGRWTARLRELGVFERLSGAAS
jgi:ectoine hydroxylase-related dioxygenase (phytanoyl-CoA dioxygenase family)